MQCIYHAFKNSPTVCTHMVTPYPPQSQRFSTRLPRKRTWECSTSTAENNEVTWSKTTISASSTYRVYKLHMLLEQSMTTSRYDHFACEQYATNTMTDKTNYRVQTAIHWTHRYQGLPNTNNWHWIICKLRSPLLAWRWRVFCPSSLASCWMPPHWGRETHESYGAMWHSVPKMK